MSATDHGEFEGHETLVSELRATAPVAPEWLRERVLELGPVARPRMSSRRKLVLVIVPAAVALAVGAAVVHAFVSSGSKRQPLVADAPALIGSVHASTARQQLSPPQSKAAFGAYSAVRNSAADQLAPLAGHESVVIPKNRLVHADAALEVKVGSHAALSKATNSATQIVASLGGYAQSVQYESSRQGYGNAFLALRVPVGKAQQAIAKLGQLGTLVSQQISTRDLQQQVTKQTNQLGLLQRAIAIYEQALQSGTLTASQRVDIQIKLQDAEHSVKLLRKARSSTLAQGATADISLTLTTNKNAIVAPHHHHKTGRFGRLLGSAAGFLGLEGIIVLYALVVLSPVVVLGGLAWWLLRERRRREDRLLASA
jgi:hypothetical protein